LNLFALTSNPSARIRKLSITSDIQGEVETFFTQIESDFLGSSENTIPFDGKYKPEDGEILEIPDFTDIDGLADAVRNPTTVDDFIPDNGLLYQIKAIFSGRVEQSGQVTVLIQKFDKRKILSTSGISLFFSENVYKKVEGKGITIDPKLTAVLSGTSLKFKTFFMLRQIFDMSNYYKEATDQDIRDFGQEPHVSVANIDQLVALADPWIKRKIGLIQQSGVLDSLPLNVIKAIADEYQVPLTIESGKIVFPLDKKELKNILRFLDEDYYKSPLTQTHWIANSKRVVGPG